MTSIGNYDIIDRVPRNDYFKGTLESCRGERDANCGCLGFWVATIGVTTKKQEKLIIIYLMSSQHI